MTSTSTGCRRTSASPSASSTAAGARSTATRTCAHCRAGSASAPAMPSRAPSPTRMPGAAAAAAAADRARPLARTPATSACSRAAERLGAPAHRVGRAAAAPSSNAADSPHSRPGCRRSPATDRIQQGTEIPRFVDLKQGGNTIRAYPALVDEGQSVGLRLLTTAEEQARAMPGGIRRLLLLAIPSPLGYVQQHLTSTEKLTLAASPYRGAQALFEDCLAACVDDVLFRVQPDGLVFSKAEFETRARPGLRCRDGHDVRDRQARRRASSPLRARPTRRSRPRAASRSWPRWPMPGSSSTD